MKPTLAAKVKDHNLPLMITIDGGSGVGKSTLSKLLADRFGMFYFQTSLLYRRLAAFILVNVIDYSTEESILQNIENFDHILNDETLELYNEEVSKAASIIAAYPAVRTKLMQYQHEVKKLYPRLLLEGRDTGSVIAPEADLKLYITANLEVRAQRRYKQLLESGKEAILSAVHSALQERDERDMQRSTAPLVKPEGAFELDNSNITLDEAIAKIEQYIENCSK